MKDLINNINILEDRIEELRLHFLEASTSIAEKYAEDPEKRLESLKAVYDGHESEVRRISSLLQDLLSTEESKDDHAKARELLIKINDL